MGRKPTVNFQLPKNMRARRRNGTIYYYFDTGGKPRIEIPLGKDYVEAVQKWAEVGLSVTPTSITVGWVVAKFLASRDYMRTSVGTQADYKFALDKIVESFGAANLEEVTPADLNEYHEERSKTTEHRATREIKMLSRVFAYARSKGWTKNNPSETVKLGRLPGRRDVYIDDEAFDAVYKVGGVVIQECLDIAYQTGQRPIDVLDMREPKDGVIEFRQKKTKVPLRIKVEGKLKSIVDRIHRRKKAMTAYPIHGYLLVNEVGKQMTKSMLRSRFEKARDAAKIPGKDFQFRDIRAKAASDTCDIEGIERAQNLLGHKSITTTEHYIRNRRGKIIAPLPEKRVKQETK